MQPTLKRLFERASQESWAIGAFSAAGEVTVQAVLRAAQKLAAPVLIQASPDEIAYVGARPLRALVSAYAEQHQVQAWLGLDRATSIEHVTEAIEAGFDLIHFDGSALDFEANVRATNTVVQAAEVRQVLVEGQLDVSADPESVLRFTQRTGISLLGIDAETDPGRSQQPPTLDLERLKDLHDTVDVNLSLHGSSDLSDAAIKAAIAAGITKLSVGSELRLAYLEALQRAVKKPKQSAAYTFLPPVIDAVQAVVEAKIKRFGSAGKAKQSWVRKVIS